MTYQQLESLSFGAGIVWAFPTSGQLGANPTPVEVGTVQNVKLTISADIKSLFGLNSFPVDSGIGKRSIKGSVEYGQISGQFINQILFGAGGSQASTNQGVTSYRELWAVPATTPFTVSVTNSATFTEDGGVMYNGLTSAGAAGTYSAGYQLERISSGTPATGQYSVSAGVYTFAAADDGLGVWITYSYTKASGAGQTFTVTNTPMGNGPILGLQLPLPYESTGLAQLDRGIYLPNVRFGKLDWTSKLDDYTMYSSDFEAFVNPSSNSPIQFFLPW
jgi:hypothetical protein